MDGAHNKNQMRPPLYIFYFLFLRFYQYLLASSISSNNKQNSIFIIFYFFRVLANKLVSHLNSQKQYLQIIKPWDQLTPQQKNERMIKKMQQDQMQFEHGKQIFQSLMKDKALVYEQLRNIAATDQMTLFIIHFRFWVRNGGPQTEEQQKIAKTFLNQLQNIQQQILSQIRIELKKHYGSLSATFSDWMYRKLGIDQVSKAKAEQQQKLKVKQKMESQIKTEDQDEQQKLLKKK